MFYRPKDGHGLKFNPFKAIVAPRPIGWISSQDKNGVANLAPYSFFQALQDTPPVICYASARHKPGFETEKDSVANIRETEEFGVSIVSFDLRNAMNASSATLPREVDEFAAAGLKKMAGHVISAPLVEDAPISMECTLRDIIALDATDVVIGDIVGVHIKDTLLEDGILDITQYQPLARMGYKDYAVITEVFALERPKA
ncbi:MAG: flavin reductase family protein [Pseudomonadota bacterium]